MQKRQQQYTGAGSLLHRVESVIRRHSLLRANDRIIVGVSGGADSLALLHLLHALDWGLQLIAVYIDHGLRPEEIDNEIRVIKNYCRPEHIPFIKRSVDVRGLAATAKSSLEESARILRHEALERIRIDRSAAFIALAHTADDQVEEFFIRLMRGTSLRGLSGMQIKRDFVIRPLLHESKACLIHYLRDKGIIFCQDSSNFDRQFLRNRIRLDLLPWLEKEFNPAMKLTTLQNMDILSHDENFIEEATRRAFEECVSPNSGAGRDSNTTQLSIRSDTFGTFHHAIQRRIIEGCFWLMKIKPAYLQIRSLLHFIHMAGKNAEIHLADGVRVTKSPNQIIFAKPLKQGRLRGSVPADTLIHRQIPGTGSYTIKDLGKVLRLSESPVVTENNANKGILFLDREKITFPLLFRPPDPGERFRPYNAPGRKKILRYLAEKKIAVQKRHGYPVLVSGNKVIALPGLQIAHEFRVTGATRNILVIELVPVEG